MSSKILIEYNDLDIAEVDSVQVSRISQGYLVLLEGILFYKNNNCSKIKNTLFLKRVNGFSYLAQLEIIEKFLFISNENYICLLISSDSNFNIKYLNFYSKIISSWNTGDYINWKKLSKNQKKVWLDACNDFSNKKNIEINFDITIDCNNIKDIPSLYCCLGEAFLGERGYIGSNLDSFDDCLIDIKHSKVSVIFKNSSALIKNLNTPKNKIKYQDDYTSVFLDILKTHKFCIKML